MMPREYAPRHSSGLTDEEIRENEQSSRQMGRSDHGGYSFRVEGNKWEITAFDQDHGTRRSYYGTMDSDEYERHDTAQNINRKHAARHDDNAYRAESDAERGYGTEHYNATHGGAQGGHISRDVSTAEGLRRR